MAFSDRKLNAERLKSLLDYQPATGSFRWKVRPSHNPRPSAGDVAGYKNDEGYVCIRIDRVTYKAHRLAWLYTYGRWPLDQVDHVNGAKDDNRITNLREASNALNQQNVRRARVDNGTGFLGVSRRRNKFVAQIRVNGKPKHLGDYETAEQAHLAYLTAKRLLHPGNTL